VPRRHLPSTATPTASVADARFATREGVAELGGLTVVSEHADHVVGADRAGEDRADDAQDVGPVPFDPGQVEFAAGGGVEGPVVSGRIDAPELLVGEDRRGVSGRAELDDPAQHRQEPADHRVALDEPGPPLARPQPPHRTAKERGGALAGRPRPVVDPAGQLRLRLGLDEVHVAVGRGDLRRVVTCR